MAPEQQYALTRTHRPAQSMNKTARQVVPAFLQKLYEMVNDPANEHLIRWSDAGDSFFVLDHERFASEVLGRWFKHRNFSTFVRQLNMYGFHKVPHLQQGALRSDTDTEFWNYEHPHFQRGQPDLLCLIQRKKQANHDEEPQTQQAVIDGISQPVADQLASNQPLDVQAIVSGIAAIKRHQATISADLNELKSSNQMLWQDAITARARHQKHQDTINRILKFLAGVFGHNTRESNQSGPESSRVVVPRNHPRLMIEQARSSGSPSTKPSSKVSIAEVEDEEELPSSLFASIETPSTTAASTPVARSPAGMPSESPFAPSPAQEQATHSASQLNNGNTDLMQTTLAQLLQQPQADVQRILAALSAPFPNSSSSNNTSQNQQQLTQYPHNYIPQQETPRPYPEGRKSPSFPLIQSPPSPLPALAPSALSSDTQRLEDTWQAHTEIDKDVNALQSSISSLMETLGFDPATFAPSNNAPESTELGAANGTSSNPLVPTEATASMNESQPSSDFDFDAFLKDFSHEDTMPGLDASSLTRMEDGEFNFPSAFLDEVPSPSERTASPAPSTASQTYQPGSPDFGRAQPRGRKRKSDIADLEELGVDLNAVDTNSLPLSINGGDTPMSIPTIGGKAKRKK